MQEGISDGRLQGKEIRTYGVIPLTENRQRAKFVVIKCPDCSSEQITFERASSPVTCRICGSTLATPTGGQLNFKAEIVRSVEDAVQP